MNQRNFQSESKKTLILHLAFLRKAMAILHSNQRSLKKSKTKSFDKTFISTAQSLLHSGKKYINQVENDINLIKSKLRNSTEIKKDLVDPKEIHSKPEIYDSAMRNFEDYGMERH